MNLTHDQIKRAAALLDSLEKWDKQLVELAAATEVRAWAQSGHNVCGKFERTRSKAAGWSDDHGAKLHHFLMDLYRASRERVARELRQLDVSVPDAPR